MNTYTHVGYTVEEYTELDFEHVVYPSEDTAAAAPSAGTLYGTLVPCDSCGADIEAISGIHSCPCCGSIQHFDIVID